LKGAILILFIYEETAPIIFNAESTTVSLLIAQTFDWLLLPKSFAFYA